MKGKIPAKDIRRIEQASLGFQRACNRFTDVINELSLKYELVEEYEESYGEMSVGYVTTHIDDLLQSIEWFTEFLRNKEQDRICETGRDIFE